MTVLMYEHFPEGVGIIADTLATDTNGTALYFVNKVFTYPIIDMVMAVTGVYQIGLKWNELLIEKLIVRDIDNLDDYATVELNRIWNEIKIDNSIGEEVTCTIYHFGWSKMSNQYVRYIYRSANNFKTEKHLDKAFGIKPALKNMEVAKSLSPIELIKSIKNEQDNLPVGTKLYIGGNLVAITINRKDGINIQIIHKFEDFEKHWLEMNEKLH